MVEAAVEAGFAGRRFGAFRAGARVEADGFALIHEGVEEASGRRVTLRILRPELAKDGVVARAIATGARAAAAVESPHVVRSLGHGLEGGLAWAAYEALPARTARAVMIEHGRLPLALAGEVVLEALAGLEALHAAGWVHADVKPGNLRRLWSLGGSHDPGRPGGSEAALPPRWKLTDLDLAQWAPALCLEAGAALEPLDPLEKTRMRAYSGTPEYSAPEQCAGERLDARADLYATGIMLFEMLTGVLPLSSMSPEGFLARHMVSTPRTLAEAAPDLRFPAGVQALIDRALEKEREDRFGSAAEMAGALREVAAAPARAGLMGRLLGR